MRAYWDKPDEERPRLELVRFAEREPKADPAQTPVSRASSLPNDPVGPAASPDGGHAASRSANLTGLDVIDLGCLSTIVLPRLLIAVGELDLATQESDTVAAITACRRILACALMAKTRADNLETRLS